MQNPRPTGATGSRIALLALSLGALPWVMAAAPSRGDDPTTRVSAEELLGAQERILWMLERARASAPAQGEAIRRSARSLVEHYVAKGVFPDQLTEDACLKSVAASLRARLTTVRGAAALRVAERARRLGIPRTAILPPRDAVKDRATLALLEKLAKAADPAQRAEAYKQLAARPMGGPITAKVIELYRQATGRRLREAALGLVRHDIDPAVDAFVEELLGSTNAAERRDGEQLLTPARSEAIIPALVASFHQLSPTGRRAALDYLRPYSYLPAVQDFYAETACREDNATLARLLASRLRASDERSVQQLAKLCSRSAGRPEAVRVAAIRALARACPSSGIALAAVLDILADRREPLNARLAVVRGLEPYAPLVDVRPSLANLRQRLEDVLVAEPEGSRLRVQLERLVAVMKPQGRRQQQRAQALRRIVETRQDFEQNLRRIEELLAKGGLPNNKVEELRRARDRLKLMILSGQVSELVNSPRENAADRAAVLGRVEQLLNKGVTAEMARTLQRLRKELRGELDHTQGPDIDK